MPGNSTVRILHIDSSGRQNGSATRALTRDVADALEARHGDVDVVRRDLADGVGFVDERWIEANFTPEDERTPEQRARLAESDRLVEELKAADAIVIGAPIYNFGVPAALKAWIDLIARVRLTFRYTENGPEGLLGGKKAYVVIASGGVPIDGAADFATPYLRHALEFVGIDDIEVISADRINARGDSALDDARVQIANAIHAAPAGATTAAA